MVHQSKLFLYLSPKSTVIIKIAMKKYFLFLILALFGAFSAVSCDTPDEKEDFSDAMVWDITPVVYKIILVDAAGNDLLSADHPNAIVLKNIAAEFKGETYRIVSDSQSKALMPYFYGLDRVYDENLGYNLLVFGELDGAESYENEELVIKWGDGTSDIISFTRTFKLGSDGYPEISHKWFLNGKESKDNVIKIIKSNN